MKTRETCKECGTVIQVSPSAADGLLESLLDQHMENQHGDAETRYRKALDQVRQFLAMMLVGGKVHLGEVQFLHNTVTDLLSSPRMADVQISTRTRETGIGKILQKNQGPTKWAEGAFYHPDYRPQYEDGEWLQSFAQLRDEFSEFYKSVQIKQE
jgi:hypothetical protein